MYMVISPDIPNLPYALYHGVKHFELIAEPVERELFPGLAICGWGYNGTIPGPTIQVYPGDMVNIRVCNALPAATSVHWHGLDVPNNMDGVPEVEPTPLIMPGKYVDYRFQIINPPGTHMYHTHHQVAKQGMMGLAGGLIILDPHSQVESDYFLLLQEFAVKGLPMGVLRPGSYEVDPLNDDLQFFTLNGRCFPATSPLPVNQGSLTRIRFANPAMMEHPIHLHGHQFMVVASDGNTIQPYARLCKNTIAVSSGETWDIEFCPDNPGNWPIHCHIPHHSANNMTKETGGMFTVVKYR
jgi:FtsP/CotA-like multicopper oxidase with cupredoxin domain